MTSEEMRNYHTNHEPPKGDLPNLGHPPMGLLDRILQWGNKVGQDLNQIGNEPAFRIGIMHNINPEVNKFMGGLLGGHTQQLINDGKLHFNAEIPGFNSNRLFFGFTRNF